jgi:deoxyribonuclease-4
VGCWHISDNKGALGSGTDRHEHIGEGEIGVIPFGMLVSDERFHDTPLILETPKEGIGDEGNLALLRKLRGRA